MNIFTLTFDNSKLEQDFKLKKLRRVQDVKRGQNCLLLLVLLIFTVIKTLQSSWPTVGACLGYALILIVSLFYSNITCYTVIIFLGTAALNVIMPLAQYYESTATYFEGYLTCLISVTYLSILGSLLSSFRFKTQLGIYLLILVVNSVAYPTTSVDRWLHIVKAVFLFGLAIYCIRDNESRERIEFLSNYQQQALLSNLYSQIDVQSFVVNYDGQLNQFNLKSHNHSDNLSSEQQNDFRSKLLRNLLVSLRDPRQKSNQTQFMSQNNVEFTPKKYTLEEFLFYLFTNTEKIAKLYQVGPSVKISEHHLTGVLEQEFFNIQVIQVFDLKPSVIIFLSENKKSVFIEELQLRNKIHTRAIDHISNIFHQQIRLPIIYFHWIYYFSDKKKHYRLINQLLRATHSKIFKAYNDFQNVKAYFTCNTEFERCYIQTINIVEFVDQIVKLAQQLDSSKETSIFLTHSLKNNMVRSDIRQLKQLFFNLFHYCSQHSQIVSVSLSDKSIYQIGEPFVKVRIEYSGASVSKQTLNSLPIVNPQTLHELRHNSQKSFELELPISLLIIRKLGPFDKIYLGQSKRQQSYLEFYIFKELQESFHLVPVISLHPKSKLVTQTSSALSNHQVFCLSPRVQLDSYRNL